MRNFSCAFLSCGVLIARFLFYLQVIRVKPRTATTPPLRTRPTTSAGTCEHVAPNPQICSVRHFLSDRNRIFFCFQAFTHAECEAYPACVLQPRFGKDVVDRTPPTHTHTHTHDRFQNLAKSASQAKCVLCVVGFDVCLHCEVFLFG